MGYLAIRCKKELRTYLAEHNLSYKKKKLNKLSKKRNYTDRK